MREVSLPTNDLKVYFFAITRYRGRAFDARCNIYTNTNNNQKILDRWRLHWFSFRVQA